jgi:hypothetical protein
MIIFLTLDMKEHMEVFQKILGKDHKTRPLYYLPSPFSCCS